MLLLPKLRWLHRLRHQTWNYLLVHVANLVLLLLLLLHQLLLKLHRVTRHQSGNLCASYVYISSKDAWSGLVHALQWVEDLRLLTKQWSGLLLLLWLLLHQLLRLSVVTISVSSKLLRWLVEGEAACLV